MSGVVVDDEFILCLLLSLSNDISFNYFTDYNFSKEIEFLLEEGNEFDLDATSYEINEDLKFDLNHRKFISREDFLIFCSRDSYLFLSNSTPSEVRSLIRFNLRLGNFYHPWIFPL
jgi:hypothetical protein